MTRLIRGSRLCAKLLEACFLVGLVFPRLRPHERDRLIERWCRDVLRTLSLRLVLQGERPPAGVSSVLFVANHVSWLDILVLNACRRMRFVAKADLRRWPIVGWLATKTRTLFLRRTSTRELARITKAVGAALRHGQCVTLFPEGTTTDGSATQPFHSGLFEAAVSAEALVWPVALFYQGPDGSPARDIAFIGDQSLLSSVWKVLAKANLTVHVTFTEPLRGATGDRRELATCCRRAIDGSLAAVRTAQCPTNLVRR